MVEPFSKVGMIAQVSAIQPTMDRRHHASCDPTDHRSPTTGSAHMLQRGDRPFVASR